MSAGSSVGEGGGACQVVRCGCDASVLPVEVTLASGLMLELAACPNHADRLVEEFDSLVMAEAERVA
jgi:hypothetical protein